MINENQKTLNRVQIFLDLLFIPLSFIIAYYFRFDVFDGTNNLETFETILPIFVLMPTYFLLYSAFGLYSSRRTKPLLKELTSIVYSNIISMCILTLLLYMLSIVHFSRYLIVFFGVINIL